MITIILCNNGGSAHTAPYDGRGWRQWNFALEIAVVACRCNILDGDVVLQNGGDIYLGRQNICVILFGCVVEGNGDGVIVMAAVRGLDVGLLATLVVAVALLGTAELVLVGVGVAR